MLTLNEADTRAKLIDPAIHKCGWTEDLIRREETAGTVEIISGKARRRSRGKIDYVLRVKVNVDTQPVALALIEAKKESLPPGHGLDQAKGYAECKRHNVRFIFSSNGHQYVEFDCFSGLTSAPRPIATFPSPAQLRARYERGMGYTLESPAARPLLQRYHGGEGTRRYYQDAAIYNDFSKFRYYIDQVKFDEMRSFQVCPGDLIMSCSGTMGKVAIIPENAPTGVINQALLRLTPTDHVFNTFLKVWMESENFQQSLADMTFGAAIKNVASVGVLKDLRIPLPPLPEQLRIAGVLKEQMAAAEKARTAAEEKLNTINALPAALLRRAFAGEL
jgi:hypothetical protein